MVKPYLGSDLHQNWSAEVFLQLYKEHFIRILLLRLCVPHLTSRWGQGCKLEVRSHFCSDVHLKQLEGAFLQAIEGSLNRTLIF